MSVGSKRRFHGRMIAILQTRCLYVKDRADRVLIQVPHSHALSRCEDKVTSLCIIYIYIYICILIVLYISA